MSTELLFCPFVELRRESALQTQNPGCCVNRVLCNELFCIDQWVTAISGSCMSTVRSHQHLACRWEESWAFTWRDGSGWSFYHQGGYC